MESTRKGKTGGQGAKLKEIGSNNGVILSLSRDLLELAISEPRGCQFATESSL